MTGRPPPPPDPFVERVMGEVRRKERRMPLLAAALAVSALVLAVPALVVLLARPAADAALALALAGSVEAVGAVSDNPVFWALVAIAAGWGAALARRAVRRDG